MAKKSPKTGLFISILLLIAFGAGGYLFVKHKFTPPGIKPEPLPAQTKKETEIPKREKTEYKYTTSLQIYGSPEFKKQVSQALKLIWIYDRKKLNFIRKYVYEIREADSTDFRIINQVPTVLISDKNAFKSLTWCAGIILHQAFHAYAKYIRNRDEKRIPPPPGEKDDFEIANPLGIKYTGLDIMIKVEDKATKYQISLLKKIGAPKKEILRLKRRKKQDFTISHDGKYSVVP